MDRPVLGRDAVPTTEAESGLDASEILAGIGEGFFALDADWRFIAFNAAAEGIFNLRRDDVIGRKIWDVSPGIVGTAFERHYRRTMSERINERFETFSVYRPDRYHQVRSFPLGRGIGVAFLDVSRHEVVNRTLKAREAELARVQRIGGVGGLDVDLVNGFEGHRSPEYLHLHGLTADSATEPHDAWLRRLHPDDRMSAEQHLLDTLAADATTYTAEYRIIRPNDGEVRWIRAVAEIERDAEGRATKLIGAHLDITDRKLAEQALAESEVRFRSIANSAPVPIWVSGLDGRREFVNQAFVDFLGLRIEDAMTTDMSVLLHPDDRDAYIAGRARGEMSQLPFSLEGRFRRHDGAWRWMRAEFQTRRNASGEPDGFIAVAHDITESKAAAQKLTQMNEMLELRIEERSSQLAATEALIQTFFQHSSECHAVIVESVDGRFRYEEINPATLQLYNKSRSDVIGHPIEDVVGAAGAADITHHLRAALIAGVPQRYERTQAGSIVEAFATPVPTEPGSPRRVIVSARDVTERRHLEEQLRQAQKMEAVGQLTGGIAHDFNNLLTIVLGGLEAIGRQTANLAPSTAVTRMERSRDMAMQGVQRAAALTSRLLAFSRQQALAPQTIDANRLVAGLTDMLHRSLGEAVMLEVDLSEELWSTYADPNQLENALLNLAVNARDAMPEGGKLTIATRNIVLDTQLASTPADPITPGQYVMIAVTDTGSGMDQATKDRAFDPFFTTKDVGKGTGLGLSQVYGFTRQSAGHVRIESQPGKGTTVRLYLPRRLGSDERVDTADMGTAARALPGESILVVEDDETLRIHTLETLRELGYRVEEAATGVVAINRLRSGPAFNLVLTDIVMAGGINGREVAERAQKDNPGLKVLFMTGYSRNTVVKDGQIDAGIHLLGKPFSYHDLARKVRSRLDAAD